MSSEYPPPEVKRFARGLFLRRAIGFVVYWSIIVVGTPFADALFAASFRGGPRYASRERRALGEFASRLRDRWGAQGQFR